MELELVVVHGSTLSCSSATLHRILEPNDLPDDGPGDREPLTGELVTTAPLSEHLDAFGFHAHLGAARPGVHIDSVRLMSPDRQLPTGRGRIREPSSSVIVRVPCHGSTLPLSMVTLHRSAHHLGHKVLGDVLAVRTADQHPKVVLVNLQLRDVDLHVTEGRVTQGGPTLTPGLDLGGVRLELLGHAARIIDDPVRQVVHRRRSREHLDVGRGPLLRAGRNEGHQGRLVLAGVLHGSTLSCSSATLHRADDLRTLGSAPPGVTVLSAEPEAVDHVFGDDLEDEEGVHTESVPRGGDDEVTGLDVVFHGSSISSWSSTLHPNSKIYWLSFPPAPSAR